MEEIKELLEILSEAEEDVKAGRIAPIEDTFTSLPEIFSGDTRG